MVSKCCILCIAIFLLSASPANQAQAARFTGGYLIHMCSSDENGRELVDGAHIACQAYIAGVLDYHNLIRSLGTAPSVDFCIPEGVNMNTLQKNVLSYFIRNRHQHERFVAAPGVALALYSAYPCAKKKVKN